MASLPTDVAPLPSPRGQHLTFFISFIRTFPASPMNSKSCWTRNGTRATRSRSEPQPAACDGASPGPGAELGAGSGPAPRTSTDHAAVAAGRHASLVLAPLAPVGVGGAAGAVRVPVAPVVRGSCDAEGEGNRSAGETGRTPRGTPLGHLCKNH